jgi:hypothetical protein
VLAATLHSGIPVPGIQFIGEAGSGKTQMVKTLRDFVNPSNIKISTFGSIDESMREIGNNFVIAFDNMGVVSNPDVSNYLCQCLTRASMTTRKKYTTNEDFIQHFACTVMMTGIEPVSINFEDLSDRIINIEVPYLSHEERAFNILLDHDRDEDQAKILSGLVQLALEATPFMMKDLEKYRMLKKSHKSELSSSESSFMDRIRPNSRFADWDLFSWNCCELLFPNGGDLFRAFLDSYIPAKMENFLLRNPLYQIIAEWAESDFEETPFRVTELYALFEGIRKKLHLQKTKSYPGSSAWLPRRMEGIRRHLKARGINFTNFHSKDQSFIEFFKVDAGDAADTESSPADSVQQDEEQRSAFEPTNDDVIETENGKDIEGEDKV